MNQIQTNKIIQKESINKASRFFLLSNQSDKNELIDKMFKEQPSISEFLNYLDKSINSEFAKEVIVQLTTIFYYSFTLQGIRIKRIDFDDFMKPLSQSVEMKSYFHNSEYNFDADAFRSFYGGYNQKEILNYTHFAINNQFKEIIETENDAIFYLLCA
jgi:hypothetical protein